MRYTLFAALLLAGCSTSNPVAPVASSAHIGAAGGTITSADGRLTLQVPAGALPTETTITIDVVTVSANDVPGTTAGAAYELGPDGTQFATPVTVLWLLPDADAQGRRGLPFLTVSGGVRQQLDEPVIDVAGDGSAVVGGTLAQLSTVVGLVADGITFSFEFDGTSALVGEAIEGSLLFHITDSELVDSATLRPTFEPAGGYSFEGSIPIAQVLPFDDPVTVDVVYRCEAANDGRIGVAIELVGAALALMNPEGVEFKQPHIFATSECRAVPAPKRRNAAAATRLLFVQALDVAGKPVEGAEVLVKDLLGSTASATTDADGLAAIVAGPTGTVVVTIKKEFVDAVARVERRIVMSLVGVLTMPGLVLRAPGDTRTVERDGDDVVTTGGTLTDGAVSVEVPTGGKVEGGAGASVELSVTEQVPHHAIAPPPSVAMAVVLDVADEAGAALNFVAANAVAGVSARVDAALFAEGVTPQAFVFNQGLREWLGRGAGTKVGDKWVFDKLVTQTGTYGFGRFTTPGDITIIVEDADDRPLPNAEVRLKTGERGVTDANGRVTISAANEPNTATVFSLFLSEPEEIDIPGTGDLGTHVAEGLNGGCAIGIRTIFDGEDAPFTDGTIDVGGAVFGFRSNEAAYFGGVVPSGQGDLNVFGTMFDFEADVYSTRFFAVQAHTPNAEGTETTFRVLVTADYSLPMAHAASGAHVRYTDPSGQVRLGYTNQFGGLTVPRQETFDNLSFRLNIVRDGIGQMVMRSFASTITGEESVACMLAANARPFYGGRVELTVSGTYNRTAEGETFIQSHVRANSGITRQISHTSGAFEIGASSGDNDVYALTFVVEGVTPQNPVGSRRTTGIAHTPADAGVTDVGELEERLFNRPLRINFQGPIDFLTAGQFIRPTPVHPRAAISAELGQPQQNWDVQLAEIEDVPLQVVVNQFDGSGRITYHGTFASFDEELNVNNADGRPRVLNVGGDGVGLESLVPGSIYRIEERRPAFGQSVVVDFVATSTTQFVPTPVSLNPATIEVSRVRPFFPGLSPLPSLNRWPTFDRNGGLALAIGLLVDDPLALASVRHAEGLDLFGGFGTYEFTENVVVGVTNIEQIFADR